MKTKKNVTKNKTKTQRSENKSTGIYLGDATFNRKLSVYYSWFAPVVLTILAVVLFIDKAYVVALLVLALALYLSPVFARYKLSLPPIFKAIIVIIFIYLIFQSMYLYIK